MTTEKLLILKRHFVYALRTVNRELGCPPDDETIAPAAPAPVDSVDYALLNAQIAIDRLMSLLPTAITRAAE